MKTNTSIVKNLGAAALVFTLSNNGASAAEVDAQIATASAAVQQALAENTIDNMLEVSNPMSKQDINALKDSTDRRGTKPQPWHDR